MSICYCYVTDDGVEGLCGGEADIGKEMLEGQRGQCKSLQKFEIHETLITQKGVQIALQNLPDLKHFNSFDIAEALVHMHRNDMNPPSYALVDLDLLDLSPSKSCGPIALRLATSFCPFLLRLSVFRLEGITDSDLLSLIALKRLSILRIIGSTSVPSNDVSLTFDRGLALVLKTIGPSLKQLELNDLSMSLRLESILEYCPNLEFLSISNCSYSSLSGRVDEQSSRPSKRAKIDLVWPNLKKLQLTESSSTLSPESLLLAMTSAPNLKELAIYDCETLDDDILHRAFQIHPFNNLSSLTLYNCNAVTKSGVDLFIQNENNLREASIGTCVSLSVEDFDFWLDESEKNNWNFRMVDI